MGILPSNNLTIKEVQNLIKNDHRLITAIHHVLASNKAQLNWSQIRNKQIEKMKNKLIEELERRY